MGSYIPCTAQEQEEMLAVIGVSSVDDLYHDVPESVLIKGGLRIADGLSEAAVRRAVSDMAGKNHIYRDIYRGAGAYRHMIPAAVSYIAGKEEFLTTYTPYQAEISQGALQSIFEYQSMIAELTTMDASNASVYDGATAAAEAMSMCRDRKRNKTLVAASANPETIAVMRTYAYAVDEEIILIPSKDGRTDLAALEELLAADVASVYIEQPNFYGIVEDAEAVGALAHGAGAKMILGANPIALAVLKSPRACGADIVVGDGQPLGLPMAYGGPSLGFMACTAGLLRKLPGRIVGETVDADGERAYVLTLQAREQHIRREKSSSNICSNQAHCALTVGLYMAAMGPAGLREVALQSMSKAHYLAAELAKVGFAPVYDAPFFHEFVTTAPVAPEVVNAALAQANILGGLALDGDMAGKMLWCATEMNSKADMDRLVAVLKEASKSWN